MNRRTRATLAAAVLSLLVLGGCATPLSGEALEDKLRQAGASVRGLGGELAIFPIEADSKMAAWTMVAESRQEGPLGISRQLHHKMVQSSKHGMRLVVGGPYSFLTRQVVLDALTLNAERRLSGFTLVYVGSAESARDARAAAAKLGIRFVQREMP